MSEMISQNKNTELSCKEEHEVQKELRGNYDHSVKATGYLYVYLYMDLEASIES